MISQISAATAVPVFEIKVFVVILVQLAFGFAYRLLGCQNAKQIRLRTLYGFAIGQITYLFLYSISNCLLFCIYSAAFYFLAVKARSPKSYFSIVFSSFSLLSFIHFYRLIDPSVIAGSDMTFVLMILIPKKIYFVSYIYDINSGSKKPVPTFTEYMGYLYNFLGNSVLPIYSFYDYRAFILREYPKPMRANTHLRRNALIFGLTLIGTFGAGSFFNSALLLSDDFQTYHILVQAAYLVCYAALIRCRYYTAWTIANMHMIAADFRCASDDFQSYVSAIEVYEFETTCSVKKRTAHWNVSIAKWLKACFYIPLVRHFGWNAELGRLCTFVISAFWHGFHPTYYLVFVFFFIDSLTERLVNRIPMISHFFPKLYYMFIVDLSTILFNHLAISDLMKVIRNASTFYMFKITVIVALLLCNFTVKPVNLMSRKPKNIDAKKVDSN